MQLDFVLFFAGLAVVRGLPQQTGRDPEGHVFRPAGPDDSRSPCPWLNALANHGYLPRDGRFVTREHLEAGFEESLNIVPGTLEGPVAGAISTGTRGDGTFDLEDTVQHNVIEHDGSLSRNDALIGDALHFNSAIWNRTLSHFKSDDISVDCIAAARLDRMDSAQALNPLFNLTPGGLESSFVNQAVWLASMGDHRRGTVSKLYSKVVFEQERLPFNEGFKRSETSVGATEVGNMFERVQLATVKIGLSRIPKVFKCSGC